MVNGQLTTHSVVYKPDKEKFIKCYVVVDFAGGWSQADSDHAENVMSCMKYVITCTGCPLLWCSNLHM